MPRTPEQKKIHHDKMREALTKPCSSFNELAKEIGARPTSLHKMFEYYKVEIPEALRKNRSKRPRQKPEPITAIFNPSAMDNWLVY